MPKRQLSNDEIKLLIKNVSNLSLDKLIKAVNILRPQAHLLPLLDKELLQRIEDELRTRK